MRTDSGTEENDTYHVLFILNICYLPAGRSVLGKDAKYGKLIAVRTRVPDGKIRTTGERAISQSDSRI